MKTTKLFLTRKEHDLLMEANNELFQTLMAIKHTWSLSGPNWDNVDSELAVKVIKIVCPDVLTINQ